MKARFLLPILIVLALVVAACDAPIPELRSQDLLDNLGLITGDPCLAPCWNGITPGETSWNDALTIIEDDPLMVNIDRRDDDTTNARLLIWQQAEKNTQCCQLYSQDGEEVTQILLLTTPDVTVGQVIDTYGEPEYVSGTTVSDDQAILFLLYPQHQLIVYAFVAGPETGVLSASSEIVGSTYLTEEAMQQVLEGSNFYYWAGYQSFNDYAEKPFDITAVPQDEATGDSGNSDGGGN